MPSPDPGAYYNEFDHNAAEWLRNLQAAGEIAPGVVDERSIKEVDADTLVRGGYRRAHFFAGIGGWDLALRLAGWPEDREVWSASCPCQPFSSAGKGGGTDDPRHLWPDFFRLVRECRPATVFGEQVASKAGLGWLDGVFADLEGAGYACGAVVVGAHSVGAPHIRQRLYWAADRPEYRHERRPKSGLKQVQTEGLGADSGVVHHHHQGQQGRWEGRPEQDGQPVAPVDGSGSGGVEHSDCRGLAVSAEPGGKPEKPGEQAPHRDDAGGQRLDGPWSDYRLIPCTDGKTRRTGSSVFPLVAGLPRSLDAGGAELRGMAQVAGLDGRSLRAGKSARIGMLKGSGNSIIAGLAAEFIRAYLEAERTWRL